MQGRNLSPPPPTVPLGYCRATPQRSDTRSRLPPHARLTQHPASEARRVPACDSSPTGLSGWKLEGGPAGCGIPGSEVAEWWAASPRHSHFASRPCSRNTAFL